MDKKEILAFITKNPIAYLATSEDNTPHVRALGTFRADESGIIFSMQSDKNVYKQVCANPRTEICYFADGVQVRINGELEPVADMDLKKEIAEARPFLKPGVEQHGWDYVGVFKVVNARASVLNMGKPGPMTYTDL
ncbi:MAG: pyridoxamine 5'-phosphate oxidase family protein [Dehalococcoidales bacterium]|nr:pyridoxamine 5'-phosphate oxidase family protein [Dehalococcoidales bacterium]